MDASAKGRLKMFLNKRIIFYDIITRVSVENSTFSKYFLKIFSKNFSFRTKVFFFFQKHPFQTFLVSKHVYLYMKKNFHLFSMSSNSSWGRGGEKALADSSDKNVFFTCSLHLNPKVNVDVNLGVPREVNGSQFLFNRIKKKNFI